MVRKRGGWLAILFLGGTWIGLHWRAPYAALAATGAANAGIVQRSDLSGFNWSKVPTVLVEMGFMSNRAEDKALTTGSYQQKLAVGLANGVVDYLKTR